MPTYANLRNEVLEPITYIFERFRIRPCFVNQPRGRATRASAQLQGWRQRVIIWLRRPSPTDSDLSSGAFECPANNDCQAANGARKVNGMRDAR